MTNWRILKIMPLSLFKKCSFRLYLDSILSKISNDTKITQNRGRMKKLWQKKTRGAKIRSYENLQVLRKFVALRIFAGVAKLRFFFVKDKDFLFIIHI